jgi:adenylosuccinate lyase
VEAEVCRDLGPPPRPSPADRPRDCHASDDHAGHLAGLETFATERAAEDRVREVEEPFVDQKGSSAMP